MNTCKNLFSGNACRWMLFVILLFGAVFILDSCAQKVTVNPDGTFTPATVNIPQGQTIEWSTLSTTDSIVQIADPGLFLGSDPCGLADSDLDHRFDPNDRNEFTGPPRQAVSGIFSLGPDEGGFVQIPFTDTCACENPALPERFQCAVVPPPEPTKVNKLETVQPALDGNNYKLCPGEGGQHQTMDRTWANPDVTGVTIRLDWSKIQTDSATYYWDDLNREMNAAVRNGKLFILDIRAGMAGTPDWIFTDHNPPGPITPITGFKDETGDSPSTTNCGYSNIKLASPTDTRYRDLYVAMIRTVADHVAGDSRWYQALAHVKVSGANFVSSEARLPKQCLDADGPDIDGDGKPDGNGTLDTIGADNCVCNPQVWANAGYTPAGLYEYYRVVGNAVYNSFYKRKSLGYQLIQAGFPKTISSSNFEGDSLLDQAGNPLLTPPGTKIDDIDGTKQTESVLQEAREGRFTDPYGALRDNVEGKLFVPQHSGLQPLPDDRGLPACSQHQAVNAVTQKAAFPVPPGTHGDNDGACPNKWAVEEGTLNSQIMGFQTNNAKRVNSPDTVESALWNMTINSNGVFLELYEQRIWEIDQLLGSGAAAAVLYPNRPTDLPPPNPAPFSKNLSTWVAELHERRRGLIDTANPHTLDPFPGIYSFTFSKPLAASETYFYINPAKCSQTASADRVGQITVSPFP